MQRLHEADLAGHLLEAGGWDHLNLPALAEIDEDVPLGGGRTYDRAAGEPLHAAREPRTVLEDLRRTMGSAAFSAQYQQAPVPPSGLMIDRSWLKTYDGPPEPQPGDRIVQSWDCASKDGVLSDWSVCITALLRKRQVYVLDVYRNRLIFPDLHRQAIALARRYGATAILIEDAASGTQLIQQLHRDQPYGVPMPLAPKALGDKVTRMSGASQRIEAGELLLPAEAPWLAEFQREVLAFPSGRHDDQVDALSQLLNWKGAFLRPTGLAAPEIITLDD
ncbi:phage terminase large subunit [Brevundimonas sp.]|uniref:phage terminase large subunit n=1 Tax=Brevundimonas sp. TaxID=1871086 RepID=UPI002D70D07F|nr:phage terminase large subunit [Brevundimonas sp.]HYC99382.1 phage terminase large subunit [Brevundimonas sp.]